MRVLARDESIDGFNIFVHIITCLVVAALWTYTGWGEKHVAIWIDQIVITGYIILTLDVIESHHPMMHGYSCLFPVQETETQQFPDQLHQLES